MSPPIRLGGGDAVGPWQAFASYIPVGFDHIVPKGLDHILFVLGLFFLSTRLGPLLWQVSAFTLAHTVTLALGALGWLLGDAPRAERLLALTGLSPDALRAGLGNPAMLGAVLDFLAAHEPDLVAAAEALGVQPQDLMAARERL